MKPMVEHALNEACSVCNKSLKDQEYFVSIERKAKCIDCSTIRNNLSTGILE